MSESSSALDAWLRVGSALLVAQFAINSLKGYRNARRLVPIGSITPAMIEDNETVPVCFLNSETRLLRTLLWLYGRFWVRQHSPKQG